MANSGILRARRLALIALLTGVGGCDECQVSFALPRGLPGRAQIVEPESIFLTDAFDKAGSFVRKLAASMFVDPQARGAFHILRSSSVCQPAGGVNPTVQPRWREPRVGEQLEVTWSTRAGSVPPPPDDMAWLFVSLEANSEQTAPLSWSASGCTLLVNPDYVMVPSYDPNAMLHRVPGTGTIVLRWTPIPAVAGQRFFSQLLVYAPGETTAGYLLSPALEVQIGGPAQ